MKIKTIKMIICILNSANTMMRIKKKQISMTITKNIYKKIKWHKISSKKTIEKLNMIVMKIMNMECLINIPDFSNLNKNSSLNILILSIKNNIHLLKSINNLIFKLIISIFFHMKIRTIKNDLSKAIKIISKNTILEIILIRNLKN